jgi:hypothetical protein
MKEPEVILDLSNDEYHGEKDHISSSKLKVAYSNIEEFEHDYVKKLKVQKSSEAMDLGTVIHVVTLEDHLFEKEVAIYEKEKVKKLVEANKKKLDKEIKEQIKNKALGKKVLTQKEIKAKYKDITKEKYFAEEFKKQNPNKTIITDKQYEVVKHNRIKLSEYPEALELVRDGVAETSIFFQHPSGKLMKTRPDYLSLKEDHVHIVDVKTCHYSPTPKNFKRKGIDDLLYGLSAAKYIHSANLAYKLPVKFTWLVCQTKPPYSVAVFHCDQDTYLEGFKQYNAAVDALIEAEKTNNYRLQKKPAFLQEPLCIEGITEEPTDLFVHGEVCE